MYPPPNVIVTSQADGMSTLYFVFSEGLSASVRVTGASEPQVTVAPFV